MAYNPNPNPNGAGEPLSPCRISATSNTQENYSDQTFSPLPALSVRDLGVLGLKPGRENSRMEKIGCRAQTASMDSAIKSSDLVVRRSLEMDDEEEAIGSKRRKKDEALQLFVKLDMGERRRSDELWPFFIKTSASERHHLQSEVIEIRAGPMDDLDLELRLGDRPKVR
ncbi:uncharacterized protein LOC131254115 [Magnolia sinica]|uniref:uncharacterized protein LOC131254115 n=1 Tax=Magnolia sinica TaxID=86752 RepID=UPI00265824C3|nr:uncharacterized protein LOC131254115 [Magnolia sinica]